MRAYNIVPISVAALLITVVFASVVSVSAASAPLTATASSARQHTQLSLSASALTPTPGRTVTFSGTLKATKTATPLAKAKVDLQIFTNDKHWSLIYAPSATTTNANGAYRFFKSFPAGTYYFRAYYPGSSTYREAFSPVTKITVKAQATVKSETDPPAASQTDTPTIYYVPQAGSTWVNQGTAGASYNAYVSDPSAFQTQSNGYPYWGDDTKNDFICIPAGSATNNQDVVSWEIGFHFTGPVPGERFQKIWDKAYGGFFIEIDTNYGANNSYLTIYRATTGGSGARWYIPTTTALRAGHNYYVQIAWDTSAGPGHESYPTIWIGEDGKAPVLQTSWDESGGALGGTGSWYNDAVGSANLGNTASDGGLNTSQKIDPLNGGIFVYRQFNTIVNFSNGGNWNTDKLRWT